MIPLACRDRERLEMKGKWHCNQRHHAASHTGRNGTGLLIPTLLHIDIAAECRKEGWREGRKVGMERWREGGMDTGKENRPQA